MSATLHWRESLQSALLTRKCFLKFTFLQEQWYGRQPIDTRYSMLLEAASGYLSVVFNNNLLISHREQITKDADVLWAKLNYICKGHFNFVCRLELEVFSHLLLLFIQMNDLRKVYAFIRKKQYFYEVFNQNYTLIAQPLLCYLSKTVPRVREAGARRKIFDAILLRLLHYVHRHKAISHHTVPASLMAIITDFGAVLPKYNNGAVSKT